MPTDSDISALRRFARWHRSNPRPPSRETLEQRRLFAVGAAGAALAILLQLLQAGPLDGSLTLSAVASGVALTCGIFDAIQIQMYLSLGEPAFPHLDHYLASGSEWLATRGAMVSLFLAVSGVLWHLSILALLLFVLTALAFVWHSLYWFIDLARWWFAASGPGAEQSADDSNDGSGPA